MLAAPAAAAGSIEPDRPDLTDSARPVARGVVQLESGLAYERTRRAGAAAERPPGRLAQAVTTAWVSHALGRHASLFTEFFFATREERDDGDQAGLPMGLVVVLTPSLAVDAAALTSLIGRAPHHGLRAGVSVRFGR